MIDFCKSLSNTYLKNNAMAKKLYKIEEFKITSSTNDLIHIRNQTFSDLISKLRKII